MYTTDNNYISDYVLVQMCNKLASRRLKYIRMYACNVTQMSMNVLRKRGIACGRYDPHCSFRGRLRFGVCG